MCLFPVTTPIGLGKKNTISCICSEQSQSNRESRPIHHPLIGWYIGSPKTRLHSRMVILTIKAVWCPRHNHRSSVNLGVYIISSPPPHFLVGAHLFEEAYVYIYLYREPFTTIISGLHHCPCLSQKLLPPTCDVASLSSILK